MPWIFLSLMLVNAAYFGWKFVGAEQPRLKVEEPVEAQGQRLQLLGERQDLVKETVAPVSDEEVSEAPIMVSGQAQCFNIGPFASDSVAQRFAKSMSSLGFSVRMDKRRLDEKTYWVFIPPFTNRLKAEEKLRELKARNINGFIVKDGVFLNAISLNHFSRKELAQSFLQEMQAAGIGVESREINRSGWEPWVYVGQDQAKADLREKIEQYLSSHESLKRENAVCANN